MYLHHSEIDTSYYVLTVDLWSAEGNREVNLVRHSATSPSISAATSSSYPPPPPTPPSFPYGPPMTQVHVGLTSNYGVQPPNPPSHQPQYNYQQPPDPYQQQSSHTYQQQNPNHYQPQNSLPPLPPALPGQTQSYYTTPSGTPITPTHYYQQSHHPPNQGPLLSPQTMMPPTIDPRSAPSGMFTRNLIGSLCVSAFKLTDPDGVMGVWFILQDLSVRTEGSFRYVYFHISPKDLPRSPPPQELPPPSLQEIFALPSLNSLLTPQPKNELCQRRQPYPPPDPQLRLRPRPRLHLLEFLPCLQREEIPGRD